MSLRMLPARRSVQSDPLFATDPTLKVSLAQLKNGRLMPVETELRAVWDAMRPPYQGLSSGAMTPAEAAATMQRDAVAKIEQIHMTAVPDRSVGRDQSGGPGARGGAVCIGSGGISCNSCATGGATGWRICSCCRRSSASSR